MPLLPPALSGFAVPFHMSRSILSSLPIDQTRNQRDASLGRTLLAECHHGVDGKSEYLVSNFRKMRHRLGPAHQ